MNPSPKKILWPTDFSALSLEAAQYARRYQEKFDAELHLLHVCPVLVNPGLEVELPTGLDLSVSQGNLTQAAKARLAQIAHDRFGEGSSIVCESLTGNAWPEICGYAERKGIDLIIVATHGLTGLRHSLLGGTAERIVRHAHCPVLIIKSIERE